MEFEFYNHETLRPGFPRQKEQQEEHQEKEHQEEEHQHQQQEQQQEQQLEQQQEQQQEQLQLEHQGQQPCNQDHQKNIVKMSSWIGLKDSLVVLFTIFVASLFTLIFNLAFRNVENLLNPILLIVHFFSFLLSPVIIICRNPNLKYFAITSILTIYSDFWLVCPLFKTNTRIHPVVSSI